MIFFIYSDKFQTNLVDNTAQDEDESEARSEVTSSSDPTDPVNDYVPETESKPENVIVAYGKVEEINFNSIFPHSTPP